MYHSSEVHPSYSIKNKAETCLVLGARYLVEDNEDYALSCAQVGVKTFLLNAPWNQRAKEHELIERVDSWPEITSKLI